MFLSVSLLLLVTHGQAEEEARKIKVLSFGGNGNIGSSVLARLIAEGGYDIVVTSRGNWHWDSEKRIAPHVRSVICDRNYQPACAAETNKTEECDINAIRQCSDLMEIIEETDKFDLVLDFSGYEPKWIHDACVVLKGKAGVYIYISTDSVYEVSVDKPTRRPSIETDAVRPTDEKEVKLLKRKDAYGHYKLACEEALSHYRNKEGGAPWVSLRLADVIGPRDTTNRWWTYQLWVQFYPEIERPVYMPAHVADKIESLTYVEDVANVVIKLLQTGEKVWDQAYNIAMEEDFSLSNILLRMRDGLGMKEVLGDSEDSNKSFYLYPTVFAGKMDITKAKEMLDFVPTSADEAFKESLAFYKEAFINFPKERDAVLTELFKSAVPKARRDLVYLAIDRELGKAGKSEEKFAKKKKGELGGLPRKEEREEL